VVKYLVYYSRKKFSRLAIARHIFRPPHKLYHCVAVLHGWCLQPLSSSGRNWHGSSPAELRSGYWDSAYNAIHSVPGQSVQLRGRSVIGWWTSQWYSLIFTANRCSWFTVTKHKQLCTTPILLHGFLLHEKLYENTKD